MEEVVWLIVPLVFLPITFLLFKFVTNGKKVLWPFIVAALVSVAIYFFVRPTCGCIGIDQIFGALTLAVPFNFLVFSFCFIAVLVITKIRNRGQVRRSG
jgi:hypothetical protein